MRDSGGIGHCGLPSEKGAGCGVRPVDVTRLGSCALYGNNQSRTVAYALVIGGSGNEKPALG